MKTKDKSRKWMWMFLAVLVSLQMYFVWELLAVFALFAVGLGIGGGADCRQPAPGDGGRAAGHLHDRSRGAQAVSTPGFCASPLSF